jgi:hypothetical protein
MNGIDADLQRVIDALTRARTLALELSVHLADSPPARSQRIFDLRRAVASIVLAMMSFQQRADWGGQ